MVTSITDISKAVEPILRKYGVKRAQAFGSAARNEMRPESDVDIFVSFTKPIDGWSLAGMADELEHVLGRPVDLVTESGISEHFKPYITAELATIYDERS